MMSQRDALRAERDAAVKRAETAERRDRSNSAGLTARACNEFTMRRNTERDLASAEGRAAGLEWLLREADDRYDPATSADVHAQWLRAERALKRADQAEAEWDALRAELAEAKAAYESVLDDRVSADEATIALGKLHLEAEVELAEARREIQDFVTACHNAGFSHAPEGHGYHADATHVDAMAEWIREQEGYVECVQDRCETRLGHAVRAAKMWKRRWGGVRRNIAALSAEVGALRVEMVEQDERLDRYDQAAAMWRESRPNERAEVLADLRTFGAERSPANYQRAADVLAALEVDRG